MSADQSQWSAYYDQFDSQNYQTRPNPGYPGFMIQPGQFNFYGSQMASTPLTPVDMNQVQNGAQTGTGKGKGPAAKSKSYDIFDVNETKLLVNLWAEDHDRLESKDSRTTWSKIVETLNKQYKNKRTVDKCKRRMKYLVEKYKEKKDWNKKQSGGNLKKSPFYDEIDAVLGTRDVVTFEHVEQSQAVPSADECTASTSNESSPSTSSTNDTGAKKRKSRKRKKTATLDSDDEDNTTKSLREQGEKITDVISKMQETQSKQVDMMGKFMEAMLKMMSK